MMALLTIPVLAAHIIARGGRPWPHAAALGATLCFLFTASGHFLLDEQMAGMLPPWTPYRLELVWATGVIEIAIALGLALPGTRRAAAWAAIAVLCLFFPANIYAALVAAPVGGHVLGPAYLVVRGPVQLFLILWIYATLIRRGNPAQPRPR
ncbi:MAG: DoxX family protein [Sphingopyxis sp.]